MNRKMVNIAATFALGITLGAVATANAAGDDAAAAPRPVHVFAQVGVGLVEIAHVEAGAFLGPHLTVEGMVASDAVFGGRYGGGVFGVFGRAQGRRPPRHAVLAGARLMLDGGANFDSHGDDLTSYGVVPVGYGFLADNGFYFRATVGAALIRERKTTDPAVLGMAPLITHELAVGPMVTTAAGVAF
jgi:hypothetical protein